MLDRQLFDAPSVAVTPLLLGAVLRHNTPEGTVAVRLTEVEAYLGEADPRSHAYRQRDLLTRRNGVRGPARLVVALGITLSDRGRISLRRRSS